MSTDKAWMEFLNREAGCCGLCGNSGIIDTMGRVFSGAHQHCGVWRAGVLPLSQRARVESAGRGSTKAGGASPWD